MQDDFGEFLQAPLSTSGRNIMVNSGVAPKLKDLDSKIMESFDLSGSAQKASFRFQQPLKNIKKKPLSVQYKESSSSANWKALDLNPGEFIASAKASIQQQRRNSLQGQQMNSGGLMDCVDHTHKITGYHVQAVSSPLGQGYASYSPVPSQVDLSDKGSFSLQVSPHLMQNEPAASASMQMMQPSSYAVQMQMQSSTQRVPNFTPFIASGGRVGLPKNTKHHMQYQQVGAVSEPSVKLTDDLGPSFVEPKLPRTTNFVLPSWMTNPREIPPLYKEVLKLCATPNSFADTARLYPIFVSSQLPKDVLGHIWSAANQSSPGQLTFSEVYLALALIALAQRGEMNLTVNYVTKLIVAPIPRLELPMQQKPQTYQAERDFQSLTNHSRNVPDSNPLFLQSSTIFEPAPSNARLRSMQQSLDDDFSDFQSVPPAPLTSEGATFNANPTNSMELDSLSIHSPVSGFNPVSPEYPDRDIINSPKARDTVGVSSKCKLPPKPLLSSIDFSKIKPDYKKTLYDAAKSLNMARTAVTVPSTENEGSFGEFKNNAGGSHLLKDNQNKDMGSFIISSDYVAKVADTSASGDFSDFMAAPVLLSQPNQHLPSSISGNFATKQKNLLDGDETIHDKYSALRNVGPTVPGQNAELNSSDQEFTDFQSVSDFPQNADTPATVMKDNSFTVGKGTGSSQSVFGKVAYKEDSQSVSSLELPSLSKTISSMSIGSTSPIKPAEELQLSQEKVGDFGDFATFSPIPSGSASVVSSAPDNAQQQIISRGADDELYSLDEPISPLRSRKLKDHVSAAPGDATSPPMVRPYRLSEADSDFGDFSSGPPPVDDLDDQHADFDPNQGGTSSLVDFDAFGHFEEAKEETKRKKQAIFNQKRSKKDATAFSEFVKSSIENMKQITEVDDPSNSILMESGLAEEGSSSFCGEHGSNAHTISSGIVSGASDEKLTVELNVNGTDGFSSTWRLDSTISEPEEKSTERTSRWDEEGEELKARMEGSSKQNTVELYVEHWGRCLVICKDIIVSTGEIFASLDSPTVCHEIVNSSRGREFIVCTSEVYGVARRIRKGMESVGVLDDDLNASMKEVEIAWQNLLGFCPYTPSVHKTPEHCCSTPTKAVQDGYNFSATACSLCLLSTTGNEPVGLEYGGKLYHAPCANLWLNQIAPILPRLELPV